MTQRGTTKTNTEFLQCESCEHPFTRDEAGPPVYECSTCGSPQVEENRCEQCNKFCAKVADYSCPECETSAEDVKTITEEQYAAELARVRQEEAEAEERRRNPPPPSESEIRRREERQRQHDEWTGEDSLGNALRDIADPQGTAFSEDGTLGGRWERLFRDGSTGSGVSVEEAVAICEKIKRLEREAEKLREEQRAAIAIEEAAKL